MAVPDRNNTNLAYDLSLFDTDERQEQRERERRRAEEEKKRREIKLAPHSVSKTGSAIKVVACLTAIFALLYAFNYYNTKKDDMARMVATQKQLLADAQSDNELLQNKLDNKVNISYIEQYATDKLGMQKVTSAQKKYISVNTESLIETEADNNGGFLGSVRRWFNGVLEYIGL